MNLTLTVDDALAAHAAAVAATRGKSLSELVRELLEAATAPYDGAARAQELEALWASSTGDAKRQRVRREDAYQDRVK